MALSVKLLSKDFKCIQQPKGTYQQRLFAQSEPTVKINFVFIDLFCQMLMAYVHFQSNLPEQHSLKVLTFNLAVTRN